MNKTPETPIQANKKLTIWRKQRRKLERHVDETLRDKIEVSQFCTDSYSVVMAKEGLREAGHPSTQDKREGNATLKETFPWRRSRYLLTQVASKLLLYARSMCSST